MDALAAPSDQRRASARSVPISSVRQPLSTQPGPPPPRPAPASALPAAPSIPGLGSDDDSSDLEPSADDSPLESFDTAPWSASLTHFGPTPEDDEPSSSGSSEEGEDVWENMERIMRRASHGSSSLPMPHPGPTGLDSWPDSWQEAYLRTGLTPIAESLHSYSTDWNGSPSRESLVESHPPTLPGSPSGESRASGASSSRPHSITDCSLGDPARRTSSPVSSHSRSHSNSNSIHSSKSKSSSHPSNNAPHPPGFSRPKSSASYQTTTVPPTPYSSSSSSSGTGGKLAPASTLVGGALDALNDGTSTELTVKRGSASSQRMRSTSGASAQKPLRPEAYLSRANSVPPGFSSHAKAVYEPDNHTVNPSPPAPEADSQPPSALSPTWDRSLSGSLRSVSSSGESRADLSMLSRRRTSSGAYSLGDTASDRRESTSSTAGASSIGPNASASVANSPIDVPSVPLSLAQQQQQEQPPGGATSPAPTNHVPSRPSRKRQSSRAGSRNAILAGISTVSVSLREKASTVPTPAPASSEADAIPSALFSRASYGKRGPGSKSPLATASPKSTLDTIQSPPSSQHGSTSSTNSGSAKGSGSGESLSGSGSGSGLGSGKASGPGSDLGLDSVNGPQRYSFSETSTASVDDDTNHHNASGEEESGAITPRALAGSPEPAATPSSSQHLRQRAPWASGPADSVAKLTSTMPVPILELKLESSSVNSRAESARSSGRGSDVHPNESLESLSERSRSPSTWGGPSGATARGVAPRSSAGWVSPAASAALSALNSLSDPKEGTSHLDATATQHRRKEAEAVDILNQMTWSDLTVVRYLLSWGKNIHTARALLPVPPVEMLGDVFLCGRERGGATPTEWSFLDQLPTKEQWTLVQHDGREVFNLAGYLIALITALIALMSATTPTRLAPGPRTEPEFGRRTRQFSMNSGENDQHSWHSSSSKGSIASIHTSTPRKTQWGWQERDLGTISLLVLYAAFVPLKTAFDTTVGAVYRWDSISVSLLSLVVWIAAWKYDLLVPIFIASFLVVMFRGSLAAYSQDLAPLRQVASASLGLHPQASSLPDTGLVEDESDLTIYCPDAVAWAENLIRLQEQLGNIFFWRAPGASRRAVVLLLTSWLLLLVFGLRWVSLGAAIIFFSSPLRLKLGLGGKGGRTILRLLAAPDDTELAMELIRQRASSALIGLSSEQNAMAAGLTYDAAARLAQQSLGQPTWLAQATYGIQVDNAPLLLVLSSTRLNFAQVPGTGLDELSGHTLPPPFSQQQVVLDVSLDRLKLLTKLGHGQLFIQLRPASQWFTSAVRASERFASAHLETSSRGQGVALTFPDTMSRDTAFNHILAVAPFVWRTERY